MPYNTAASETNSGAELAEATGPHENENVTFKVTPKNVGLASSGNCSVKCYQNGNEISFSLISGLEAGSTTSFTFNWVPTGPGSGFKSDCGFRESVF